MNRLLAQLSLPCLSLSRSVLHCVWLCCLWLVALPLQAQTLVADYRMDELQWTGATGEVIDSSTFNNHGSARNGANTASARVCRGGWFRGEGFNADPNNAWYAARYFVEVPAHSSLSPLTEGGDAVMGISAWIKPDRLNGTHTIVSKGDSDSNREYRVHLEGGKLHFTVWNRHNSPRTLSIDHTLTAGQWYYLHFEAQRVGASHNMRLSGRIYSASGDSPIASNESGPTEVNMTGKSTNGRLFIGTTFWSSPTNFFDGIIDELKIFSGALTDAQIIEHKNSIRRCPDQPICLSDDFSRSEVGDDWAVTNRGGSFGNPRIVNGRLRLTDNTANVATAATFQRLFPSQGNLVTVEFDFFAYGGSGADGVTVVLSDAAVTPAPGGYGGSLGYANRSGGIAGFAGGWLGIGLDSFGNFSNPTEGRSGGPGRVRNAVAMRGSGSGQTGYAYIAGTDTLSPSLRSSSGQRYRITIDSRQTGQSWVTVERDTGQGFVTLIGPVNVLAHAGQAAVPENLLLTLTGSTGGSNDNHEIDNVDICATRVENITHPINHFRILHSGQGLTCAPETVTLQACADNACTRLYEGPVKVALTPANTSTRFWTDGGAERSFSGGQAQPQFRSYSTGAVTLGILDSSPTATNVTRCYSQGIEGSCALQFAASGLVVEVPSMIANRPEPEVLIAARRTDPANPDSCAPAMTGLRNIELRSTYTDPNTGTARVSVNGSPISHTSSWTNFPLEFDEQAQARIRLNYADAGLLTLHARYRGSAATEDSGLTLTGSTAFVVRPAGLCVETPPSGHCAAADLSCPKFIAAGEAFKFEVRAVAWEADGDIDLCRGNAVTPNYRQSGLSVAANLLAPADGMAGVPGVRQIDFGAADAGIVGIAQSHSEVGVFSFSVTPPAKAYFGETVPPGQSQPIGRFVPHRLGVSINTPVLGNACAGGFSYSGQPITYLVEPRLTVSGLNRDGEITHNYFGPFWRLGTSLAGFRHVSAVPEQTLETLTAGSPQWHNINTPGGQAETRITETSLRFQRPERPQAPFSSRVELIIPAAALTDADGVCVDSDLNQVCDTLQITGIGGGPVRWGRLALDNVLQAQPSEAASLTVRAEYFDGAGFVLNSDDQCTILSDPRFVALENPTDGEKRDGRIMIGKGETVMSNLGRFVNGLLELEFSAPGNSGFTDVIPLPVEADQAWLADTPAARGRVEWGMYRGPANVIHIREIWR